MSDKRKIENIRNVLGLYYTDQLEDKQVIYIIAKLLTKDVEDIKNGNIIKRHD